MADVGRQLRACTAASHPTNATGRVILTVNYGEAGALEQARSRLGLPPIFSGYNGFADWGPLPDGAGPTLATEARDTYPY